MQKTTKTSAEMRRKCIGCEDCQGLCQALVELAFLPETLLKTSPLHR